MHVLIRILIYFEYYCYLWFISIIPCYYILGVFPKILMFSTNKIWAKSDSGETYEMFFWFNL